ncbi:MAG: oligosaccharide flippase family protein [Candidatus Daviesbacteria bacterium]|nr:oligosaccharide flippase family protein [Candidatus Daviesbacteria bacterium]
MKNNIDKLIKNPLFVGSLIVVIGSNFASLLNLLYHPILGKMLGPNQYGELVAIISLLGLLAVIPTSLTLVVVKYAAIAKDDKEVSSLVIWLRSKALLASSVLSILLLVSTPLILSFLRINNPFYLILVMLSFIFSSQSILNKSVLQGLLRFKEMIISLVVENGLKLLISIFLVYLGFQAGGAVAGFTFSAIIGWFITKFYLRNFKKENTSKFNYRHLLVYIVPVLVQSFSMTSLYSSDVILVKHFFPSYEAGLYGALATMGRIIFFGAGPISAVMFPMVSRNQARGYEYRKIFIYSFLATLILALFILGVYWFIPKFAINLLYGSAYQQATGLLIWSGVFMALFTFSSLLVNFHLSLGYTKVVYFTVIAALLQIVAIWFYHPDLLSVIKISILITALLLACLLIYSSCKQACDLIGFKKRSLRDEKIPSSGNQFNIGNSSGL